jgi:hypothetical protein
MKDRRLRSSVLLGLAVGLLGGASCGLIPQRLTDCSESRPCSIGQMCDPVSSTCVDAEHPFLNFPDQHSAPPDMEAPACTGDCLACQVHSDCPSLVCDWYQRTTTGGTCIAPSDVVYVDNRNGSCEPSGDGETPARAFCGLAEALAQVDGTRKRAVRVMPSTADYGTIVISDRTVSIFGPAGQGGTATLRGSGTTDALTITGTSSVVVDGMDINRGKVGVLCRGGGATLSLHRTRVTSSADVGVLISDCGVELDRVLLRDNGNGALAIGGTKAYSVTNSVIARNRSSALPAIKISSSGLGAFRLNTVVDNTSVLAAAIECTTAWVEIRDSIVYRNSREQSTQIRGCQVKNTVVGTTDVAAGIRENPTFAPVNDLEYGLDAKAVNSCCIGRALCSVREDYFGFARPRGEACDIGAHEAR